MDPASPEALSKKRKDSLSHWKRDQPLFASRRFAPSQQAPDFFTESLNASYAPSPSPAKSPPKRQNGRSKNRPTSESGRSLAAAFTATSNVNDENRRPTSSHGYDPYRSQHSLKPRPSQSNARPHPSPRNQLRRGNERTKTPSPARGRQFSLVSPVSSQHSLSSPPRGLAEAYQRIVDEESLAQEESADDEMAEYGYDFAEETDLSELNNAQDLASPTSLKASQKASREPSLVRNQLEKHDNTLNGSGSGSQRSSLDNVTDRSLDSTISQHSKDAQRLNGALRSNIKVFSKARVGERVGLTVENLRRRNNSHESLGSPFAGSLTSKGSDLSLNLPKAWGRKAKPPKDWLSRINSKSGKLTGDVPKKQKADSPIIAESEKREWEEPIDSWIQAGADDPLASEVNASTDVARSSSVPAPTKEDASGWDVDADFTGRSLQISDSPPLRIRNATPGGRRNRDIDNLEKRAVTTSRLVEIRERTSLERLSRQVEGQARPQGSKRSSSRSSTELRGGRRDSRSALPAPIEGNGEPIPDTPVVVYKNSSDPSDGQKSKEDQTPLQRPQHERQDSRDILQRLARATSASPASSTGGQKHEPAEANQKPRSENTRYGEVKSDHSLGPETDQSSRKTNRPDDHERAFRSRSRSSDRIDETPQPIKPSTRVETPQVAGAWVDNTITEKTPLSSMPNGNLKTPLVTGAWVDTPLPAGGRGPPMPTPNVEDDKDFILEGNEVRKLATSDLIKKLSPKSENVPAIRTTSRPLPRSALESVLNAAKASLASQPSPHFASDSDSEDDPPLHLGESTIQSLEEIFADDTSFSSPPSPPALDDDDPDKGSPTTELKPYSRQLSRLSSLLPSIRDARKHISQLERAVASSSQALTVSKQDQPGECTEAGEFHDFIWPCERCGCSAAGRPPSRPLSLVTFNFAEDMTTITIPVPRLWRWERGDWRPRLTWLGFILVVSWSWWIAEGVMCDMYCHPRYAWTMEGYGVDINSPEPPFVLEQMLWRWMSLGAIFRPLYGLLRAIIRLGAQTVGYIAGLLFGSGNDAGRTMERRPISTDPRIPKSEYAPDLSMYDDENL